MTAIQTTATWTPPKHVTVRDVGRLYVRPGRVHGRIVEQVDVTAVAQGDCIYLDIDGASRALCYQLSRDQFTALAAVLDSARVADADASARGEAGR